MLVRGGSRGPVGGRRGGSDGSSLLTTPLAAEASPPPIAIARPTRSARPSRRVGSWFARMFASSGGSGAGRPPVGRFRIAAARTVRITRDRFGGPRGGRTSRPSAAASSHPDAGARRGASTSPPTFADGDRTDQCTPEGSFPPRGRDRALLGLCHGDGDPHERTADRPRPAARRRPGRAVDGERRGGTSPSVPPAPIESRPMSGRAIRSRPSSAPVPMRTTRAPGRIGPVGIEVRMVVAGRRGGRRGVPASGDVGQDRETFEISNIRQSRLFGAVSR
jgi:hypothetical protein